MCINRFYIVLFSIVGSFLMGGFGLAQKTDGQIMLHDEKLNFTPNEFYIAEITDDRAEKGPVAFILDKNGAHGYIPRSYNMKDGAVLSMKRFIDNNLPQNKTLRPVIVSIKDLKLTETNQAAGRINGRLEINFAFSLQKNYGPLPLTKYTAGIKYTRSDSGTDMAEPAIREGIEQALTWFNKWMNDNAETDARLAKSVKIKFSDYREKTEGDTIYYSVDRPLTWADFKEKPLPGNFDAEIFTSIGYTEQASIVKGVIDLNITVKVELAKSDCWVRDRAQDNFALNHEQRHFDITKIVAEHFKQKLAAMKLPPDNYDGDINVEYLETMRELHRMQTQYDKETSHGRNSYAQNEWNKKIDNELRVLAVRKP